MSIDETTSTICSYFGDNTPKEVWLKVKAKVEERDRIAREELVKAACEILQDSVWPGKLNEHTNMVLQQSKKKIQALTTPLSDPN